AAEREARELLLDAFRDPTWEIRASAAIALGRSGTIAALPAFIRMERARVRDVRGSAAVGAGLLGDPLVVEDLARLVFDPGEIEHLRGVTLVALGLIGGPEAARVLQEFLDPAADARRAGGIGRTQMLEETAVAALGMSRCADAAPFLRKVLASGNRSDRTRAFAATSLARLGDRESLPLLHQALRADPEILRQAAAVAAGVLGTAADGPTVADLVRAAREDRDASTRRFAALSLGRIGGPAAGAALVDLLGRGRRADLPFTVLAAGIGNLREAGPALQALFRETPDPEVRGALAVSLGLLRWLPSAPDLLEAARSGGHHHLRGDCLVSLGLMGHRAALAPARAVLDDDHPDAELVADAALCLALLGDRGTLARLPGILRREFDRSHGSAGWRALGIVGDAGMLPELSAAARDPRSDVRTRRSAVEAVGAILDGHDIPVLSTVAMDSPFLLFQGPLQAIAGHR
ncbi:MAG: HEAT repeat domain-containing protein, partial [Planctomycetes bacterium]|nr:HEAT repeat domain-containing protein [Planctomycetota bacterium]